MQWIKLLKTCSLVKTWTVAVILTYFLLPFLTLLPSFQSHKNNVISSPGHKAYHTVFSPNLTWKAFIWRVCIAALSAAVRGEDCHVIDVTALQFSLPSLPVMRGVFSFPRQSILCLDILDLLETGFHLSVNRGTEINLCEWLLQTHNVYLQAGWRGWVLALQLRHSAQLLGQSKNSGALLGDRFQFCSLQWQVWIQSKLL